MDQEKRNKIFSVLSWTVMALTGLFLIWGGIIEPNRLVIRRATVVIPGLAPELEGCRALLVADTHFGNSWIHRARRERMIRRFKSEKPDICFLLGDYIAVGSLPGYGAMSEEELSAFFSALKAPLGSYAVLGNHELWYGRKRMADLLERSGIRVIENKCIKIKNSLAAAGLPDFSTTPFSRSALNTFLEAGKPQIVLTHKGGVLKYISGAWQGTLFAADTHGGQIRIPGVSSLGDYLKGKKELAPGLSTRWGRQLFITTGAGGHRLGFRLFCPPELAVVTFTKGKQTRI